MNYTDFKSAYQKLNQNSDKESFLQSYADEEMSEKLAEFILDIGLNPNESDCARSEAFTILKIYIGKFDYTGIFAKIIRFVENSDEDLYLRIAALNVLTRAPITLKEAEFALTVVAKNENELIDCAALHVLTFHRKQPFIQTILKQLIENKSVFAEDARIALGSD